MKIKLLILSLLMGSISLYAQDYFPKNDGVKSKNNNFTAFTNAKILVKPTLVNDKGSLLSHNSNEVQVCLSVKIPVYTVVQDIERKSIFPSFVDVFSNCRVSTAKRAMGWGRSAQSGPA